MQEKMFGFFFQRFDGSKLKEDLKIVSIPFEKSFNRDPFCKKKTKTH